MVEADAPVKRHDEFTAHRVYTCALSCHQIFKLPSLFPATKTHRLLEKDRVLSVDAKRVINTRLNRLVAQTMAILYKMRHARTNAPEREKVVDLLDEHAA